MATSFMNCSVGFSFAVSFAVSVVFLMPQKFLASAANSHFEPIATNIATKSPLAPVSSRNVSPHENTQMGATQIDRMSPFSGEKQIPLPAALLCHVMLLNSVLERRANRFAEEHGLTFPQWMALGCIGHGGEEGVRHSEIGQSLMLSKAPVTGLIDRLERANYVRRAADLKDRRASRVIISEKGCEVWETVRVSMEASSRETCGCFSESEQQEVLNLLARLLDSAASADPILNYSMQCPTTATFAEPTKTSHKRITKTVFAKTVVEKTKVPKSEVSKNGAPNTQRAAKTRVATRGTK